MRLLLVKTFLKRHSDINYRKPDPTVAVRAMGFNKVAVDNFFELLGKICHTNILHSEYFISIRPTYKQSQKVTPISCLWWTPSWSLISAEREKLVTSISCFSTVGNYMLPIFILPKKRLKIDLLDLEESDWIQDELFVLWLKRFIEWFHPIVLLLDQPMSNVSWS